MLRDERIVSTVEWRPRKGRESRYSVAFWDMICVKSVLRAEV